MAERKEDLEDELEPGEIRPAKPIIRESKLVLNEKLLERLRKPEKQVEFYQAIQKSMQSAAEYPPKLVQGVSSMINPGNIFFASFLIRYHSRFFVQVGHETTYAAVGNHHFSVYHFILRPTKISKDLCKAST